MPCLFAVFAFYAYGNPYAVRRKPLLTIRSLYWLASHVPGSNVSRPRFERLTSQIRSSLVPRSLTSIGFAVVSQVGCLWRQDICLS